MSKDKSVIQAIPFPPITAADNIDIKDIVAIQLRNAGTSNVVLWMGAYTLEPKDTLSINVTEEGWATLDLSAPILPVQFDTTPGPVNKLEYFVLRRHENNNNC